LLVFMAFLWREKFKAVEDRAGLQKNQGRVRGNI